ncbi:sulfite exporter TauE/SafE family protein [Arcobacter sp. HD9-500m-PIT-SAG02]|nr:sulfite exporter TauE/SafE family protein [Arcobacter sp. HD9-500m-PIT-SAG02]
MPDEIVLGLLTFLTSTVAGVVGLGGGMLLIAMLPLFLPLNAIIPVHGITQMSSNISRAYFGIKDIQFEVVPKFILGSILGVSLFAFLLSYISLEYVPLFIGLYILLNLWSKHFGEYIKKYESYFVAGFFQTGLSVIVGATGPLTMTLLLKDYEDKDKVVATGALLMSITHTTKIFVFAIFGFMFFEYIYIMIFMIIGAVGGSYFGTKIRHKIDGKKFINVLKILLTLLALRAIYTTLF